MGRRRGPASPRSRPRPDLIAADGRRLAERAQHRPGVLVEDVCRAGLVPFARGADDSPSAGRRDRRTEAIPRRRIRVRELLHLRSARGGEDERRTRIRSRRAGAGCSDDDHGPVAGNGGAEVRAGRGGRRLQGLREREVECGQRRVREDEEGGEHGHPGPETPARSGHIPVAPHQARVSTDRVRSASNDQYK